MATYSIKRYAFGFLLVLIGTALLLKNLDLLPFVVPAYVFSWKMLLIVFGVFFLIFGKRWFSGLLLTGLGMYFLIPEVTGKPIADEILLWPGLIILFGLYFLFARPRKKKVKPSYSETKQENSDLMDITAIMGGDSRQISSYDFKGGKITAIMGGLEIDLTNCTLSKENCIIDLQLVMGGVSLTIPREWNVKSELMPIMGGVEDSAVNTPGAYIDPAAQVTLTGVMIMGGLEIKRI